MAGFDHLLKSYDVGDLLDEIASAEPPAYLRRLFAELPAAQTVEQIEALLPFQIRPSIDAKAA